jgi:hypothetical protein
MLTFPLKLVLPTPDEPITTNFTVFTVVSMSFVVGVEASLKVNVVNVQQRALGNNRSRTKGGVSYIKDMSTSSESERSKPLAIAFVFEEPTAGVVSVLPTMKAA